MYIKKLIIIYKLVYNDLMQKTFKFDVIIEEEDMCDRGAEKKRLISLIERGGRIVIYSPRRMGKTSLVNVCSKKIRKKDRQAFHLYVDLNETTSLGEVSGRFRSHYESALAEQFTIKNMKFRLNAVLSRIKIGLPGGVDISVERYAETRPEEYIMTLFRELSEMGKEYRLALILDEFQGVSELKDAQAVLRREVKKLSNSSIVLMGSNQRLLYKMFNNKSSPFFGFGEDLELKPIPVSDYLPYINERLSTNNIAIDLETAEYLMEKMNNIPNYINELGAWIVDTMSNIQLTHGHIDEALESAVKTKMGRYESALYGYSVNQKKFVKTVAKIGRVKAYTGKEMAEKTGLSPSELGRVYKGLEDAPILSMDTSNRIFIIDPFFRRFLEMM